MRIALLIGLFLAVLWPVPGLVGSFFISAVDEWSEAPSSTREYAFIKRHLESDFEGYGFVDSTVCGMHAAND